LSQYGVSREDIIGRKCYEITHGINEPCTGISHICPVKNVFDIAKSSHSEHIHLKSGGTDAIVEVHAFPLFDNDGNVEFVVELIRDITERRRAEEEALKLGAELAVFKERLTFLTDCEYEVMKLVGAGKANKVIALELDISHKTVEIHRGRVMEKLKLDSVADLVRYLTKLEIAP
jgi:PAS domain S-box-containing protein